MKVSVAFDLGITDDEVEYTAEFVWDLGELQPPPRRTRIAFGELFTRVEQVTYTCPPADYIDSRDHHVPAVSAELWLRLTRRSRKSRFAPDEIYRILASLPCVSRLFVTGVDSPADGEVGR